MRKLNSDVHQVLTDVVFGVKRQERGQKIVKHTVYVYVSTLESSW